MKARERVGAGGDTINRLNRGREVGLVGSTSHLLLRPTPTNSLMSPGPVMEMSAPGHGHICWSCSSLGITWELREKPASGLGMGDVWTHRQLTPLPALSSVPKSLCSYPFCT